MKSYKRGEQTESLILGPNAIYVPTGRGRVVKREPATVWSAKKKGPIYASKGDPDFSGHWKGIAFELEAKEVTADTFYFPNHTEGKGKTLRAQVLKLVEMARSGGLAFMLVHFCSPKLGLREAFMWQIHSHRAARPCPFVDWALGLPDSRAPLKVDWFRDHAYAVPEQHGGLDWGAVIQRVLVAKSAMEAQNGGMLAAEKLD